MLIAILYTCIAITIYAIAYAILFALVYVFVVYIYYNIDP